MPRLTHDELVDALKEQVEFLHRSADLYDSGFTSEAIRLAVTLRVLLHDTKDSKSLLNQLGVKNTLSFLSTGDLMHAGRATIGAALAPWRLSADAPPEHVAMLHEAPRVAAQPFYHWWNAVVLSGDNQFSRKDVVLALAHQEGGAHVDPNRTKKYADLRGLGVSPKVVLRDGAGVVVKPGNPAIPTVRQIAFEVEVTIHEQLADLLC